MLIRWAIDGCFEFHNDLPLWFGVLKHMTTLFKGEIFLLKEKKEKHRG